MIYAATPPLPPAVYAAAHKPTPYDEPVWVYTVIVPAQTGGARIPEVAAETARSGWPHTPTMREKHALTRAVMIRTLRTAGTVTCRFRARTMARGTCDIVRPVPGKTTARYRVVWRVWADGTWAMVA